MSKNLDGVLIKRAHKQETFTDQHLTEIALCMDPEKGYLHFMKNYFYIQHPVKGKLKFDPFEFQERLLDSYHNYVYNINLLPRQVGKCFINQTLIKVKNKITQEELEITVEEFFNMQKIGKKTD